MRAASGAAGVSRRGGRGGAQGGGGGGEGREDVSSLVDEYAAAQLPHNPFLRYLDEEDEFQVRPSNSSSAGSGSASAAAASQADDAAVAPEPSFDFDSIVTNWADYLKAQLHSRSLIGVGGRTASGGFYGSAESAPLSSGLPGQHTSFSSGASWLNDDLRDAARVLLEASDVVSGFQAVVDVDSGWGGFALEYMTYLREECPRAPMLVFGAVRPSVPGAQAEEAAADSAGAHNFTARERSTIRAVNNALAFAHFAGSASDLDCSFIPLSVQAYAEAAAEAERSRRSIITSTSSSESAAATALAAAAAAYDHQAHFPGLRRFNPNNPYHTSAILASAMDSATLPFRRRSGYSDGLLASSAAEQSGVFGSGLDRDGTSTSNADVTKASVGGRSTRESADNRTKAVFSSGGGSSGGGGNSGGEHLSAYDPTLELSPDQPIVGLSQGLTMREYLTLLRPASSMRIISLSTALPLAHPRSNATRFARVMASMPPAHEAPLPSSLQMTPLSFLSRFPSSAAKPAHPEAYAAQPYAHALVMRGVGSNATNGASYASSIHAYGRVLDGYLSRTSCRTAGHAVFRTPQAIPITFPHMFPSQSFDHAGAYVGAVTGVNPVSLPPSYCTNAYFRKHGFESSDAAAITSPAMAAGLTGEGYGDSAAAVPVPFSVPTLTHLSVSSSYAPALRGVLRAFERRDRSALHRFARTDDATVGSANYDLADVHAALATIVDDYAGEHDDYD